MTSSSISNAFRVPSKDIEALIAGQLITVLPQAWMDIGKQFALYLDQPESQTVLIQAWARCEFYQMLDESKPLDILAKLINRSFEELTEVVNQRGHISLAYLRVYLLPQSIEIPANSHSQFIPLLHSLYVSDDLPALSDRDFEVQKQRLLNLEPPESLFEKIERKLEEAEDLRQIESENRKDWIGRIANVGNSSEGNDFEKLVRKGLIELGFSTTNTKFKEFLDPDKCGGAGGLDFYCDTPFAVVGECKATKSEKVPDGAAAQLVKLGFKHLQKGYDSCVKIIMAAGKLTDDAELTAIGNQMNVIRPETLQRLVELKSTHIGAINLLELKSCLEQVPHGESADGKLNDFIKKVQVEIMVRSQLVQTVKEEQEHNQYVSVTEIRSTYNAKYVTDLKQRLDDPVVKEILIELSSPLAGYLGRVEENGKKCDRFYYLRDLPCNT
jgi:hypothetical protein